jgi:Lon protease-like protein
MERPSHIPLFPLDVVLLPAMTLPLHIFEPRYKLMIRRCLDEKMAFGMVLASGQAVAKVGCTARITQEVKEYPDRRLDILTEGQDVFGLIEIHDEKEYYEATVEYLADEPPGDVAQQPRLIELFEQCHQLLFGHPWTDEHSQDVSRLSYRMAARLPMEREHRQALLEMRHETQRRESVLAWLAQFLPRLMERERTRGRAGGNGHRRA